MKALILLALLAAAPAAAQPATRDEAQRVIGAELYNWFPLATRTAASRAGGCATYVQLVEIAAGPDGKPIPSRTSSLFWDWRKATARPSLANNGEAVGFTLPGAPRFFASQAQFRTRARAQAFYEAVDFLMRSCSPNLR
jgi:hypothetical protein